MDLEQTEQSRRDFLTASVGGIGMLATLGLAGRSRAAEADGWSDQEKTNVKVVNDFCAAWATRDADQVGKDFTDDMIFRMTESTPPASGKETVVERFRGFLSSAKSAEFEVLKTFAISDIVINERWDRFDTGERQSAFHVVGVFFMREGKIAEWSDYVIPAETT